MTNKVVLVTPPDDVGTDALRISIVGLTESQTSIVSEALTALEVIPEIVLYVWTESNTVAWLIDKKHKSDLIIFNAEMDNAEIAGYMAAQPNAHYFGNMRSLGITNKRTVFDLAQCEQLIKEKVTEYEQSFR
jgi:hypothetical protein